jgi:hypothetical protein
MKKIVDWIIPMKIISESNNFDHWTKKRKRSIVHKERIWNEWIIQGKPEIIPPCIVKLSRIAPRMLDEEDNLRTAFKHIKDHIADIIIPFLAPGRADGNKGIKWEFNQYKGKPKEYALQIEIFIDS